MNIEIYRPEYLESAVMIFRELSEFYLKDMASSKSEIERNLINNVFSKKSGVTLILAIDDESRALALATVSILYPAPKETGQLFLKELFVSPKYQGSGLGRKMMSFLAKYAIDHGCSRFDWTADSDNEQAVAFYRSIEAKKLFEKIYYRAEGKYLNDLAEIR